MLSVIVISAYLAVILYIGIFAFGKGRGTGEDYFLASRSVGPVFFFLSLFATNMTAVAIIGSSGQAYREGIGIYGLLASSSAVVIPLTLFFIGTRLWALGKRFGHMTQVSYFRDRWECPEIGTVMVSLSIILLVPYLVISVMGGGTVLEALTRSADGKSSLISYPVGGALVALVVMANVFFGGMRGAVWVNVLQTLLFLSFGGIAFWVISQKLPGGFSAQAQAMAGIAKQRVLLDREHIAPHRFLSYMFIPLSSIMFPHMAMMCFTARKVTAFKKTVVIYPLCIMAIWLPCVYLGTIGAHVFPGLSDTQSQGILLKLLRQYGGPTLAGILGAGIISAVMGSDCHQILAMSTMFTKDLLGHYRRRHKLGERGTVMAGRIFVVAINTVAYLIALRRPTSIFELAVTYAFSGFAAMSPVMIAALFWKRSSKYGALASTVFVGFCVAAMAYMESHWAAKDVIWRVGSTNLLSLSPAGKLAVGDGFMPVVPMVLGSAACMVLFSLVTRPPSAPTLKKYFAPAGALSGSAEL